MDYGEWGMDYIKSLDASIEHDIKKLQSLAIATDKILRDELEQSNIKYDFAEARVIDRKTVGINGDNRTYGHPAQLEIRYKNKIVWNEEFMRTLSNRITNEVGGINRVIYTLQVKKSNITHW